MIYGTYDNVTNEQNEDDDFGNQKLSKPQYVMISLDFSGLH